jgi:hypothetical protein
VIITEINGGLGNQMFQYAAGRALAIKSNTALKLDISAMRKYDLRKFELDRFNISATVAKTPDLPLSRRRDPVARLLQRVFPGRGAEKVIAETGMRFNADIIASGDNTYLSGYWQSEKYFLAVADVIRKDFSLKSAMSDRRRDILRQINAAEIPVSLHVRRGDYVSNPKANAVHGTCAPEWYHRAMTRMEDRLGDVTYFVFSDDPAWARANLPTLNKIHFIDPADDGRDAEDMHLMAACRAHIVANSTFSWWGAWLNPREDKHVIAPREWFKSPAHDATDLVPERWERL